MSTQKNNRDYSLDFLRGLAVVFMIITHTFTLFYSGSNPIMDWFIWWGATICFTVFLFVFSTLYGLKLSKEKIDTPKELKRFIITIIGYYFIAFWVSLFWGEESPLEILLFLKQPEFTEFIITFGWYVLIIVAFKKQLKKLLVRPISIAIFGVLFYIAARYLYLFDPTHEIVTVIKSQLVGHQDWHSFGVVSYAPIFLMGLWWGGSIIKYSNKQINRATGYISAASLLILLTSYSLQLSSWGRWPPTVLFLLYGVTLSWVSLLIWRLFPFVKNIFRPVVFVGQHALLFYFGHLALLFPLLAAKNYNSVSIILNWAILVTVFALITAYIYLRKKNLQH